MITSTRNRQVVRTVRLKKRALRDKEQRFLVEGSQVALEALRAGRVETLFHLADDDGRLRDVLDAAREAGVTVLPVSLQVMEHLTSTVTPQGVVGVATFPENGMEDLPEGARLVPVLCSVRDPGNAGTILRSAEAAGADAVIFSSDSVDVYNPKTVRASAGSLFHLPVIRNARVEETVASLRGRGLQVLAAAADGETSAYEADFAAPTAILFGNEAWGLPVDVRSLADATIRVPIRGRSESLNLAASAAVVLFEAARAASSPEGGLGGVAPLARMAAHDIRSPLTTLVGFLRTLLRSWERLPDEERRDMVGGILLDAERLSSLIRLVVDAIRIEAGAEVRLSGERADVEAAATWVRDLFARSPDLPEVSVAGRAEAGVDVERVRAMLLAACEGAIWWGEEGPIEVVIRDAGDAVVAEVVRGGEPPEDAAGLLRHPERSGRVGVYAAARLASWLGGSLSLVGAGAVRFVLRLPA